MCNHSNTGIESMDLIFLSVYNNFHEVKVEIEGHFG